jgi:polyisoprenoid-binding protein YceI
MRPPNARSIATLLLLLPAAGATRTASERMTLEPQSRLWIDGKSTMRKFSCKATSFAVEVDAAPNAAAAVLAAQKAVRTVAVHVPAAKMECGNGTMNQHMLKALKSKDAPMIDFTLAAYDVATDATGVQGTLTGTLTLGGMQRPVSITAQAQASGDDGVHVTGSYTLRMTEFGLKPPSLMMGTMKVDDQVVVSFDLYLKS